jgi:sugar transferase (PEP-CTERM system associated)
MRLFNRYFCAYDLLLFLGDITLTGVAAVGARSLVVMVVVRESEVANWTDWITLAGLITVFIVVCFYYTDLYAVDQTLSHRELMLRFANGFGIACLIVGAVSYPIQEAGSQNIYLIQMSLLGFGLLAWRLAFMMLLRKAKIRGKLLIIGMQTIGRQVSEALCRQKHLGMEVVGFIGSQAGQVTLSYGNPRRICLPVFSRDSILGVVETRAVNRILIAESNGNFLGQELVTLRLRGIPVEDCHSFYERLMSKISITDLHPGWIALSKGFHRTRWVVVTKRAIDILISALGLILAAPLALFTAIAIKLESGGPVLFRQTRIGQNECQFTLYKFRSMCYDAEAATGPIWARENDPRVTRIGRIIRKLRIDEIPQMFNVLKGEMSFVGPRPERPFFVSALKDKIPYYPVRFSVKPGLTGWAQVSYPYGDSEQDAIEKLQYDLYYVKNMSPTFDLQIIFETFKIVLLGRGAQ